MRTATEQRWPERKVTVQRTKLIEALKSNREKHQREYKEALDGYKKSASAKLATMHKKAIQNLDDNVSAIARRIERFDPADPQDETIILLNTISFKMPVPQDHTQDYDVAIAMAEWEVNETVELTQSQFQCFVLDDWEWQQDFVHTRELYARHLA